MPFEDMGILRCIPEITLLEPTDNVMLKNLLPKVAERYGVVYMRVPRKSVVRVYADGCDFEIGKAAELRDGNDLTIIASGYCVAESLKAAKQLAAQGIQARVLNLFTWKPIDEEAIVRAAEETGAIVTAENHTVCGGLGSAVAEVLAKKCPVPVEMIGVQDRFGEVGKVPYLSERFGLNAQHIVQAAATACIRKQKCCSD